MHLELVTKRFAGSESPKMVEDHKWREFTLLRAKQPNSTALAKVKPRRLTASFAMVKNWTVSNHLKANQREALKDCN